MSKFIRRLAVALGVIGLASNAGTAEQRTTLTIKADGSSVLTVDKTEPRATAEQNVRMWERYQKAAESADEEGDGKPATTNEVTVRTRYQSFAVGLYTTLFVKSKYVNL